MVSSAVGAGPHLAGQNLVLDFVVVDHEVVAVFVGDGVGSFVEDGGFVVGGFVVVLHLNFCDFLVAVRVLLMTVYNVHLLLVGLVDPHVGGGLLRNKVRMLRIRLVHHFEVLNFFRGARMIGLMAGSVGLSLYEFRAYVYVA